MRPFKFGRVVDGEHFCPRPHLERNDDGFGTVGNAELLEECLGVFLRSRSQLRTFL